MKVTSYYLAQAKRLIRRYVQTGEVIVKLARDNGFKRAYTDADIRLLSCCHAALKMYSIGHLPRYYLTV